MSELTQEAILAELSKIIDNKGRVMSFHDGQTIVPNSLLEQVWLEAEKRERERIIKLLQNLDCSANGKEHDCNPLDGYTISDLIELIKIKQK